MDELRDHRDELCRNLGEEMDVYSVIGETEIDNELAEHNHAAVVEGIEHVVAALRSVADTDALELAQLAAIRKAWELALVAQMDGGGALSEHIAFVERWLDDAQGRNYQ